MKFPFPLLVWMLVSLGAAGCSSPALLARGYRATGPHALPDGSARLSMGGVALDVREIAGAERFAFLHESAGYPLDPFDVSRDGEPIFRTFIVDVINTSGTDAFVNPSFCTLYVAGDRRYPLGYTELFSLLTAAIRDERVVAKLAPALDETAATLRTGKTTRRLLVFNRLGKGARTATLEIDGIRAGDRSVGMKIPLEREKLSR